MSVRVNPFSYEPYESGNGKPQCPCGVTSRSLDPLRDTLHSDPKPSSLTPIPNPRPAPPSQTLALHPQLKHSHLTPIPNPQPGLDSLLQVRVALRVWGEGEGRGARVWDRAHYLLMGC